MQDGDSPCVMGLGGAAANQSDVIPASGTAAAERPGPNGLPSLSTPLRQLPGVRVCARACDPHSTSLAIKGHG